MPKIPVKAAPADLRWKPASLTIVDADDGKRHEVGGCRHGDLFVHPDVGGAGKWVVTHWHTGLLMSSTDSEEDSRLLAEVAWDSFSDVLALRDQLEVKRNLPAWFATWCRRCRSAGRFVSPEEVTK